MSLRDRLSDDLKTAMRAHDAARVSTIRMITARVKDADIAARPSGVASLADDQLVPLLRNMVKQRRDAAELYLQGLRPELAAKEEAEITLIETYLPAGLDAAALAAAVDAAIAETGASSPKEMGRVMAALKAAHGAALDMGAANAAVRQKLGA